MCSFYNLSAWASGWVFHFGSTQNWGFFSQALFPALQFNSLLPAGPEALPSLCCCFRLSKQLSHFHCFPDKTNCKRYKLPLNFTFTENMSILLEGSQPQNPKWEAGGNQWSRSRATGSEAPRERSTINMQCFPSRADQGESGWNKKTHTTVFLIN